MPRTKFDKPQYPPIDWVMAAILERKKVRHLEWADLAEKAGTTPDALRTMANRKHTNDWPPETRRAVCRTLGINIKTVLTVSEGNQIILDA